MPGLVDVRSRDGGLAFALVAVAGLVVAVGLLAVLDGIIFKAGVAGITGLLLASLSVATLRRVLVTVVLLEIPIQVDIYLNHDEAIAQSGALSGFNISVTTLCLVVLYLLWAGEIAARVKRPGPPRLFLAVPSFVYFALLTVSVAVATDAMLAVAEVVILAQAMLLFLYLLFHVRHRDDVIFVIVVITAATLLQSLIALSVVPLGGRLSLGPIAAGTQGRRLLGTFGSPVVLGGYLSLTLPVALGLMLVPTKRAYRWLAGAAFGLGSLALVLTLTRGAWGGYLLATGFMVIYALRRGWASASMPSLLVVLGLLLAIAFSDEILSRVAQFDNPSAQARFPLMDLAFRMIGDNPFLGVGANNFAATMNRYLTVDFSTDWIFTVHNKYLLVWAETGLASLVAFLTVLVTALRRGWEAVVASDRSLAPIAVGLVAGVAANMIHMLVDIFHARPQTQMLWLSLALILAVWRMVHGSDEKRRAEQVPAGLPS